MYSINKGVELKIEEDEPLAVGFFVNMFMVLQF